MDKRITAGFFIFYFAFFILAAQPASAWWPQGHSTIAAGAVQALPRDVPPWFRNQSGLVADCAQDPDVFKNRDLPQMTETEAPEHFFDWELLRGNPLPPTRREFLALCAKLKIAPGKIGFAPYAIAEWTQKLTMVFAQSRRFPNDRNIQVKCAVYAGILSHYAADLCMPLHVTVDHDGKTRADGTSPKTGIHARLDSLPEKLGLTAPALAAQQIVPPSQNLMRDIERQILESRRHIEYSYQVEDLLPLENEKLAWKPTPEIRAFGTSRARESTRFTASLFLTAWRDSAKVKLPAWWKR